MFGGLHYNSEDGQGPRRRKPRPRLESQGTTARDTEAHGNPPEWMADVEYVWRKRTAEDVKRLDARARLRRRQAKLAGNGGGGAWLRVRLLRSAEWAANRARAVALSRADVLATCGQRWRAVACGCGTLELRVGCDQPTLCPRCRARHFRRWRKRIVRSMDAHLRAARDRWRRQGCRGSMPGIYLITLTAPHTGDLVSDRKRLGKAWRVLSKAASYGGYELPGGSYSMRPWWGHHALVWEATGGTVNDGHMHGHAAVISQWVPYRELHAAWRAALGVDVAVVDVSSPSDMARKAKASGRRSNAPASAAYYLSKYVTKGVDPTEFTGRKAGELLVAFRNCRKVTTSERFWRPLRDREGCRCCGESHRSAGAPCSLQDIAPGAVVRSLAERFGYWIPRGVVQVGLRWDGG